MRSRAAARRILTLHTDRGSASLAVDMARTRSATSAALSSKRFQIIARVRVQLDRGEGLTIGDQRLMLEQLIKDRERGSRVAPKQEFQP